jgi:hypothetical protein
MAHILVEGTNYYRHNTKPDTRHALRPVRPRPSSQCSSVRWNVVQGTLSTVVSNGVWALWRGEKHLSQQQINVFYVR